MLFPMANDPADILVYNKVATEEVVDENWQLH